MNKKLLIITMLLLILSLFSEKTINVSVTEFTGKGISSSEINGLSDLFSAELVNQKTFKVLDRANVRKLLEEQAFQQSGCTDSACAVEIGKLLNMNYMFIGMVIKTGDALTLTVNMVSVESGEIVLSQKQNASSLSSLNKKVSILAKQIVFKYWDKQGKLKKNILKPILFGTSGAILSSGITFNILGYIQNKSATDYKESTYDIANSEFTSTEAREEYLNQYNKSRNFYITSYISYGVAAGVLIAAILVPSKTIKKEQTAYLLPVINLHKKYASIQYLKTF